MATLNDMIGSVKENLGNRSSGVIGGTPVDTVVLKAFNKGFKSIIKVANPTYYDRLATVSIVVGTNEYALPILDIESTAIKVKQITGARLNLPTETTAYYMTQITMEQFLNFRVPDSSETGVPTTFAQYGGKLYFTRYPDDAYTLTLAVNITPIDFTTADLSKVLNVDDIWIETLEAYATYYCFAKLQLTKNAQMWMAIYANSKKENKSTIYKQPFHNQPNYAGSMVADPLTDPFTRNFNVD